MMRVLLLGGTQDARILAKALAMRDDIHATISLAGVTSNPPDFGLEKRIAYVKENVDQEINPDRRGHRITEARIIASVF